MLVDDPTVVYQYLRIADASAVPRTIRASPSQLSIIFIVGGWGLEGNSDLVGRYGALVVQIFCDSGDCGTRVGRECALCKVNWANTIDEGGKS